jgi:hypothetical protein
VLQGALVGQQPDLPTTVIRPEDMRANRDFWNAIGGTLRPALDYSITIALAYEPTTSGPMMTAARLGIGPSLASYLIGGTSWNQARPGQGVAGVWVRLQETGQSDVTDADGRFRIAGVAPGTYTLAARAAAFRDAGRAITVPQPDGRYDIQLIPL